MGWSEAAASLRTCIGEFGARFRGEFAISKVMLNFRQQLCFDPAPDLSRLCGASITSQVIKISKLPPRRLLHELPIEAFLVEGDPANGTGGKVAAEVKRTGFSDMPGNLLT